MKVRLLPLLSIALAMIAAGYAKYSQAQDGHDSPPATINKTDASRSFMDAEAQKRAYRTYLARYRAQQDLMREEYYEWIGYSPSRPSWNATPQFSVPYNRLIYPWGPISRTYYFNGAGFQAY